MYVQCMCKNQRIFKKKIEDRMFRVSNKLCSFFFVNANSKRPSNVFANRWSPSGVRNLKYKCVLIIFGDKGLAVSIILYKSAFKN